MRARHNARHGFRQSRNRHRRGPRHRPRHRAAAGAGGRPRRGLRHRREPRRRRHRCQPRARRRRRDQEGRRRGDRLDAVHRRAEERRRDRQGRAHRVRPRRHPGEQCRHPARPHLPPHELVGLVGRDRGASQRLLQHEPGLRGAVPRAEFRRLRAHDLDLGAGRQFRPGQLHGGQVRHRRACRAASRSTCSASRCARTASRRSPGPA